MKRTDLTPLDGHGNCAVSRSHLLVQGKKLERVHLVVSSGGRGGAGV